MAIVLAVATEWASGHGGISTFNRELCIAWKKAIPDDEVFCLVPASVSSSDETEAKTKGVTLVRARSIPGRDVNFGLSSPARLPDGKRPDIIIGHGRHTGPDAFAQHGSFPEAVRVHFFHVAPEEIEYFKDQNPRESAAQKGEERIFVELDLCKPEPGDSSPRVVAVAVGPRLRKAYARELHAEGLAVHEFIPGFLDAKDNPNRPQHPRILMLGRGEDKKLKGLDIAAKAFGKLDREFIKGEIELLVRGAPAQEADALKAELCALANCNANDIRVRTYSSDAERISKEILNSSVVVMPSRSEGFGLVGLEAISKNVPVLVSNQSGLGEFLNAKAPEEARLCVVPVSNNEEQTVNTWAKRIEQALGNPKAAFTHARELREALDEHCSWEKSVRELARLCQERRDALLLAPNNALPVLGSFPLVKAGPEHIQTSLIQGEGIASSLSHAREGNSAFSLGELPQTLLVAGDVHEKQYEMEQSLECYHRALKLEEKLSGGISQLGAIICQKLGGVYRCLGCYRLSLEQEEKALAIRNKLFAVDHEDIASSLLSISKTFYEMGFFSKGRSKALLALDIYTRKFGQNHLLVADAKEILAYLFGELGIYDDAQKYAEQSLAIRIKNINETNVSIANSYAVIGWVASWLGDYKKEKQNFEKALLIVEEKRGDSHPSTASLYDKLGITYGALGDNKKSLEYQKKALSIRVKALGEAHPDTATSYNNLGCTYCNQREFLKALIYQDNSLNIRRKILGEEHPNTATSYNNLGVTHSMLKNKKIALKYQEIALGIRKRMLKEEHPDIAMSYSCLGMTYLSLGKFDDALLYQEKALEIRENIFSEGHPDIAASYENLRITWLKIDNKEKALEYDKRIKEYHKKLFSKS